MEGGIRNAEVGSWNAEVGIWKLERSVLTGLRYLKTNENEPTRGKPRGIFKGNIHTIAASCGELNPKRD